MSILPQGADPSSAHLPVPCDMPLLLQVLPRVTWGFLLAGPCDTQLPAPDIELPPRHPVSIQGQHWIRQCSLSEYQRIRATEGDQVLQR